VRALAATLCALVASACAQSSPVGSLRFVNQPPVTRVNDRLDVPGKPRDRPFAFVLYDLDGYLVAPVLRLLDVPERRRAMDVNAVDEVPDSTWFTNRIGVRPLGVDELHRGSGARADGPEAHKPWTILGTKVGGMSVGFLIRDARGDRYLLKFDEQGFPEMETAADAICARLLWGFGYNLPDDRVVHFAREDLILAPDATVKDVFGNKRPMTAADLESRLALINIRPGRPIRGLASRFLPGVPIGGYPRKGVRADDPNDLIPHEHRRDLRGYYVIASWLAHTDIKESNSLDVWAADPADPGRHYVVHYLVDVGKTLGVNATMTVNDSSSYVHTIDVADMLRSLVGLGLRRRPWDGLRPPALTGVGTIDAEHFHPDRFAPSLPYAPFDEMDRFDAFWAAKIIARFTPAHIRAAVEAGQLSDPRATDYLTRTLIARQRKLVRHWFGLVAPLDRFTAAGDRLCFADLAVEHAIAPDATGHRYRAVAHGWGGAATGWRQERTATASGRVCFTGLQPGPERDGYLIVRIATTGPRRAYPDLQVHLALAPGGGLRVIGLRRE
jgi:hypothetical protein